MALKRSGSRFEASIWPGFVDAMTALLLILFFVLSIFMIVQFTLRETITDQDLELNNLSSQIEQQDSELNNLSSLISKKETELNSLSTEILSKEERLNKLTSEISQKDLMLDSLSTQVTEQDLELNDLSLQLTDLASALGLEKIRSNSIEDDLGKTKDTLNKAEDQILLHLSTISKLTKKSGTQSEKIDTYKTQIETLLSNKLELENSNSDLMVNKSQLELQMAKLLLDKSKLEEKNLETINEKKAIELLLISARNEINEKEENARLSAAKREALEGLIAKLQNEGELQVAEISTITKALSVAEKNRLAEISAAEFLREKLKNADTELTAMSLALEAERKEAEDTLTKLAAANAIEKSLTIDLNESFTEVERQAALIAQANILLNQEKTLSSSAQRKLALLNTQTSQLRDQLNQLQGLLDESKEADSKAQIQLKMLGTNLNVALARVASEQRKLAAEQEKVAAEQRKIAEFESKEKLRRADEAKDLKKFRSEFFGKLREVMEGKEGVRIVGDRFVFSSEVLFSVGSAYLGSRGKTEISKVADIINQIADEIPTGIDWILRVDGHTDRIPFSGFGNDYKDNWELSQARALSVVRYLMDDLDIPANRLAANGFGEFQPIDNRDTPEAYKTNRRIELKFTEK